MTVTRQQRSVEARKLRRRKLEEFAWYVLIVGLTEQSEVLGELTVADDELSFVVVKRQPHIRQ